MILKSQYSSRSDEGAGEHLLFVEVRVGEENASELTELGERYLFYQLVRHCTLGVHIFN